MIIWTVASLQRYYWLYAHKQLQAVSYSWLQWIGWPLNKRGVLFIPFDSAVIHTPKVKDTYQCTIYVSMFCDRQKPKVRWGNGSARSVGRRRGERGKAGQSNDRTSGHVNRATVTGQRGVHSRGLNLLFSFTYLP